MLEVVISHMVVQFIVLSIQTTLMMLVLFVLYDNPLKGSLMWILLLLFLTGASGMCYGINHSPYYFLYNVLMNITNNYFRCLYRIYGISYVRH